MRILSGFVLAAAMWAQPAFQNLAPTADGSVVYFSSSLRMKGTGQYPSQPKIFVWNENSGVQLYEQKLPTVAHTEGGFFSTTAYNLVAPSISSDGRTIAITGLSDCTLAEICAVDTNRYQAEIRGPSGAPLVMNGVPSVNPNGSFVALGSPILLPFGPGRSPRELTVLDLSTGQLQRPMSASNFPRRHGVANDGTVVLYNPNGAFPVELQPWSGAAVPLNAPFPLEWANFSVPLIDASASHVFYEADDNASPNTLIDLLAVDVATGASTEITSVETAAGAAVPLDISDDGSLLTFVQFGQAWIARSDGTGLMQITNVPDPIVEIALSGSGGHVFAITSNSRILRVNLTTLAVEEIIPATPAPSGLYFRPLILTPGGYCDVVTTTQSIPALQSISIFGHDLTVLTASPSVIQLQVPYDIPEATGWPDAALKQQPDGPFESAMLWAAPAQTSNFDPEWFSTGNFIAALHQDFSSPITAANPAHPGEIIHAYGSGFGPVAPEPALGQPASQNPLSRITTPLDCGLSGDNSPLVPANIRFDGLAPGWIGLYQFDILLPARPVGVDTYLICGRAENPLAGNYASSLLPMAQR